MNDSFHISDVGLALVEHFEGCSLKAYQDEADVWTIGYGHTNVEGGIQITPGLVITQDQADKQLRADLASHEQRVKQFVTQPLSQEQFDALVSFDFNTGGLMLGVSSVKKRFHASMRRDVHARGLPSEAQDATHYSTLAAIRLGGTKNAKLIERLKATTPSTLLRNLNDNAPWDCASQFEAWSHVGNEVLPGLLRRRRAERDLFCNFGWERWKQ